ncbi:MAG: hypothetical protein WA102_05310 [Candidatus Methanoperedens sp.]
MKSKNIFILIIVSISVSVFASSAASGSAIVILSPPDNYLTNVSVITVTGEADPGSILSLNGTSLSNNNGTFSKNTTLVEGLNRIIITAEQNGNISTATVNVTLDTISPGVIITSPHTKYINTSALNVSYTSNDTDIESYRVRLNEQEWVVTNETYYLFNATEGQALIYVQAIDHAGNIGEASLNLTIDTTPPLIEITRPGINEPILSRIVEISGRTAIGANVTLNGVNLTNNNGTWSSEIVLSSVNNLVRIESADIAGNKAEKTINIRLGENFSDTMPYQDFFNQTINFSRIGMFEEKNQAVSGKYVSYLFDNNYSAFIGYSINNSESTTIWFNRINISGFKAENISISGSVARYFQNMKFGRQHYIGFEMHDNKMGTTLIDIREFEDVFATVREYLMNKTPERLKINVSADHNVTLEVKETGTTAKYYIDKSWTEWPDVTFELPDDVIATDINNGFRLQKDNKEAYLIRAKFAGGSANFTHDGNKIVARVNNSLLFFRQYASHNLTGDNIYDMLVTEGISNGTIGAEIYLDSADSYDVAAFGDMSVRTDFPDSNTMNLNVSSNSMNGTVLVVNIGGSLYNSLLDKNLIMKYDGKDIYTANNFEDIIDLTNDFGHSEYLLVTGNTGAYIFVSVPTFSSHVISFYFEPRSESYGSGIFDLLNFLTSGLFMALPAGSRELVFSLWWFGSIMMIYILFRKALRKKR